MLYRLSYAPFPPGPRRLPRVWFELKGTSVARSPPGSVPPVGAGVRVRTRATERACRGRRGGVPRGTPPAPGPRKEASSARAVGLGRAIGRPCIPVDELLNASPAAIWTMLFTQLRIPLHKVFCITSNRELWRCAVLQKHLDKQEVLEYRCKVQHRHRSKSAVCSRSPDCIGIGSGLQQRLRDLVARFFVPRAPASIGQRSLAKLSLQIYGRAVL